VCRWRAPHRPQTKQFERKKNENIKNKNRKKTRKFGIKIYLLTTVSKKFWKTFERKLLEKV
jgi:hypothetical protein